MFTKLFNEPVRFVIITSLVLAFGLGVFVGAPTLVPSAEAETQYQGGGEDLAAVYEDASQSVVFVQVVQRISAEDLYDFHIPDETPEDEDPDAVPELPFTIPDDEYFRSGQGSGVVYDMDGHIVTNYHVVENADKIDVTFRDGTMARAEVVGTDPQADVAVIKVDVDESVLHPASWADTDALYVAQPVMAIGAPYGRTWTLTTGIISALGRTLSSGFSDFDIPSVIQTDAAINPGNSGGPLMDTDGNVIGINSQIATESGSFSGIGFAVPGNLVQRVADTLIETGEYRYAWLGISGPSQLTLDLLDAMGLEPVQRGAVVTSVANGGPADQAGLRGADSTAEIDGVEYQVGGDMIIAVNGDPILDFDDLVAYLVENTRPGDEVVMTIIRDGEQQDINVTLGDRVEYQAEQAE